MPAASSPWPRRHHPVWSDPWPDNIFFRSQKGVIIWQQPKQMHLVFSGNPWKNSICCLFDPPSTWVPSNGSLHVLWSVHRSSPELASPNRTRNYPKSQLEPERIQQQAAGFHINRRLLTLLMVQKSQGKTTVWMYKNLKIMEFQLPTSTGYITGFQPSTVCHNRCQ